jgi:hypothetical protein
VEPVDEAATRELGLSADATLMQARADLAVSQAREEMPFVDDAAGAAVLRQFTDMQYGDEKATDDNAASNVEPIYVDRAAWVVTFDGVEVSRFGPHVEDGRSWGSYTAQLVVFLDANTYEFLEAVTA